MTFNPGAFTPAPQRVSAGRMATIQGAVESKLMLRHGEQQLLSIIIPVAILISVAQFPGLELKNVFPMVLSVAAASSGFTGQAISLSFDRRYGALRRTGASGVPTWAIIVGKILAVLAMVALQIVILGAVAVFFGFSTSFLGAGYALLTLVLGVAAFTALGLLLGGALSAEIVLALSNLVWFVLLALVGWVMYAHGLGDNGWWNIVPTVALAGGLADSFTGNFPTISLLSLTCWLLFGAIGAARWFRFDG